MSNNITILTITKKKQIDIRSFQVHIQLGLQTSTQQ